MPRTARASAGDVCYHVLSRGNSRQTVFHDAWDFDHFLELVERAGARIRMSVLAWCLMPNHFHLVLRPAEDGALGRWMQWLLTSHVRSHQRRYASTGRIWQGRYKAFPIQVDSHLLAVMRYVERNPVRASLATASTAWRWSSAVHRDPLSGVPLSPAGPLTISPVELPSPWSNWVDRPLDDIQLVAIRECAQREKPFGSDAWTRGAAERLGLTSTLRPRGRPPRKV